MVGADKAFGGSGIAPEPPRNETDETQNLSASPHVATAAEIRKLIKSVDNIDRVLDVNLELTVQIGSIKLNLYDILELTPGSVLEIERDADEPLDLQIGEKIIASGEVVTVGEKLGLRIKKNHVKKSKDKKKRRR